MHWHENKTMSVDAKDDNEITNDHSDYKYAQLKETVLQIYLTE